MDRLDAAAIVLPGAEVRVVARCSSTNDLLLEERNPVLLATEEQTAGRGRRGRRWHSARGGIAFSLGRRIERPVRELAALSLVAGVAAARALRGLGADVALKWPNDLMLAGGKLGGILVETRNGNYAVIGIGINYRRAPGLQARVQQPMAFLDLEVPRNEVIQRIGRALLEAIGEFERRGLDGLRSEWQAMDAHAGQRVRVRLADGRVMSGTANGLAADGSLRIVTRRGVEAVRSGRVVSARAA